MELVVPFDYLSFLKIYSVSKFSSKFDVPLTLLEF